MRKGIKQDIQVIIEYCHEFAEQMLNNGQEYYPFGAQIENDGRLVPIGFKDEETDNPESQNVIKKLTAEFEKLFKNKQIKAYVVTYDVRVSIDESGGKSDAICIDINHKDSDKIPRYYFTYSWSENEELIFGESFAIKR